MYRVLLVDDEPLALSTLKRLVTWEDCGCEIVGTASSGHEATQKLESLRPDLVICDIAMPGVSGLDLIKYADEAFPDTVFIMLTNYEDFEAARESLRFRAIEFLIKSDLTAKTLKEALDKAIKERDTRGKVQRFEEAVQTGEFKARNLRVQDALRRFLTEDETLKPEDESLLAKEGLLEKFAFAFVPLSLLPGDEETLDWEVELAEKLASLCFKNSIILRYTTTTEALLLYAWGLEKDEWESSIEQFRTRFSRMSTQIIQVMAETFPSPFYESQNAIQHGKPTEKPGGLPVKAAKLESLTGNAPAVVLKRLEDAHYVVKNHTHTELVEKAQRYILENIEKRIMLADVASHVAISPGYLSTLFKKQLGQNMIDFINQTKIDRACQMLRRHAYRVNEIAGLLGFENAFYFTRVFRRHTGFSPSEFQAALPPVSQQE